MKTEKEEQKESVGTELGNLFKGVSCVIAAVALVTVLPSVVYNICMTSLAKQGIKSRMPGDYGIAKITTTDNVTC